jgi:hypothetical protein
MRLLPLVVLLAALGCGGGGDDDGSAAPDAGGGGGGGGGGSYPAGDSLDTDTGCAGVFNPDQLVDLELTMAAGDWNTVVNDSTNSVMVQAQLSCGGAASITVGVRRKRSGLIAKPGLKIDINHYVKGQRYFGLKKLSLESGIVEGAASASASDVIAEYLGWRLHATSGAITGRAAFTRLTVNGDLIGTYVNVEVVDESFLESKVGDDTGWLFKYSGSAEDGQKTNEGTENPYAADLCYLERNGCPIPSASELAATLPDKLAIQQALTVAAVNAVMANTDAFMLKFNNYIYYDYASGPRLYFPWDLDSTMKSDYDVFTGKVPGGSTVFPDVLYSNWEGDYDAILTALLEGPHALSAIHGELDRAVAVAGVALDADPFHDGDAASGAAALAAWWTTRHGAVSASVAAH